MTVKVTYRHFSVSLLLSLLGAIGCDNRLAPTPAPEDDQFTITSSQVAVSATTMEGTFEARGAIVDQGTLQEALNSTEPLKQRRSIYGVKTLVGARGTIVIEFYVRLSTASLNTVNVLGRFRIREGHGAYEGLQGSGDIDLELSVDASPGEITRVLEGMAVFAQIPVQPVFE